MKYQINNVSFCKLNLYHYVILSILSALLSLLGLLYEKTTQNKKLRIIILVAVLGFIFSITQMGVKSVGEQAAGRERNFIDSIIKRVNSKADTIIMGLKSNNLTDVGIPLKLQQVHIHRAEFHTNDQLVEKGNYEDYKHYFNTLFDRPVVDTRNYALKLTLNKPNHYKLSLILNYLLTTDRNSFNRIEPYDAFMSEDEFKLIDFQEFNKQSPLFKYVCFFDEQDNLIGYADSKDLVNELSVIYLQHQQNEFDNKLKSDGTIIISTLRSYKKMILHSSSPLEIARTLIKEHKSECVTIANQKYYKVNLADIIEI